MEKLRLFTLIISIGCGLLFGMVSAVRGDLSLALKTGGRVSSFGRSKGCLSDSLAVAEAGCDQ